MPTYTYTPNTPNAEDPMNVTQPLILENFQAIPELIAVNHVGFNVDSFGTHNVLALQEQSTPTTTTTEIDLFCKVTGSPNPAELFIVYPQGAATTTPVQISVPYNPTATGTAYSGYVSFPSGVKLSYGSMNSNGNYAALTLPQYTTYVQGACFSPISVNGGWLGAAGFSNEGKDSLYTVKYSSGTTTYNYFTMGI